MYIIIEFRHPLVHIYHGLMKEHPRVLYVYSKIPHHPSQPSILGMEMELLLCHATPAQCHRSHNYSMHFVSLHIQGLIQGGWIGWLATPFGCAVSIILILLFEHSLIYLNNHSCKQSVQWDANRSLRQGKQSIINIFRTRKPNSVACFILFMMVVEHWQLQEHMDWHKSN